MQLSDKCVIFVPPRQQIPWPPSATSQPIEMETGDGSFFVAYSQHVGQWDRRAPAVTASAYSAPIQNDLMAVFHRPGAARGPTLDADSLCSSH